MKNLLLYFLLFIPRILFAQQLPDYGVNRVRIVESDKTVIAEILPLYSKPKPKPSLSYSWYSANLIHTTQGGYNGRLLNGNYTELGLNKNLLQQGQFKKGLKTGLWQQWNEDGTLLKSVNWKNGSVVVKKPFFLWSKFKFIKKWFSGKDTTKVITIKK